MKRVLATAAALGCLAAVGFLWRDATPPPAKKVAVAPLSIPGTDLRLEKDATEVFRRAFWREPGADDEILHAERREWVTEENGVRRWQWFLAVRPGPGLDRWLKEENPFLLAPATGEILVAEGHPPDWFPEIAGQQVLATSSGRLRFIRDEKSGILFATDSGHGFAQVVEPADERAAVAGPVGQPPRVQGAARRGNPEAGTR